MRRQRRPGHHRGHVQGVTYYVCCSGCRDAFNEDPEKYIKEYEAKKKK
jgi:YHS domain-containing protein